MHTSYRFLSTPTVSPSVRDPVTRHLRDTSLLIHSFPSHSRYVMAPSKPRSGRHYLVCGTTTFTISSDVSRVQAEVSRSLTSVVLSPRSSGSSCLVFASGPPLTSYGGCRDESQLHVSSPQGIILTVRSPISVLDLSRLPTGRCLVGRTSSK